MKHLSPIAICAAILLLAMPGCIPKKDRAKLLEDVPTSELRLDPKNTEAAELTMKVPAGFQSDWTSNAQYDKFIIFDPSDSGDVQRGMVIVNITPIPLAHVPDSIDDDHSMGAIEGKSLKWRETVAYGEDSVRIYQREAVQTELLKLYPSPDREGPLIVHVFVVGRDPKLVELLMGAVETIKIIPGKPNV